ncbi:MAG TPA: sugar ABC transporter permease [Anaerolineae bacterium]
MEAPTSRVTSREHWSDALAQRLHINRFKLAKLVFAYVGLLPVLAIFTYLRVLPIARTFQFSLFQSNLINPTNKFTGLSNFKDLFHDDLFLLAIRNTTIFALATVVLSVLIALALGVLLARRSRLGGLYETLYFLPVITPWVPVSVVWKWIYDPSYGLANYVLSWFGIKPIGWLINPDVALVSVIILAVWKAVGYNMMIFLVGIRDIPGEFYEAAELDGANSRGLLRFVTLPLLRPILLFVTIISTINAYNVFTSVYILTTGSQGAQGNAVRTLVFDIYENGFRYFKWGYASSEAVCLFVIILALTVLQFRIGRQQE